MTSHLRMTLDDLASDYGASEVVAEVRSLWPDLVGEPYTPARKDDRVTAQNAAAPHSTKNPKRFKAGSTKHDLLEMIGAAGSCTALDAATAWAAANRLRQGAYHVQVETARKRVSDLARVGFLVDTGRVETSAASGIEATLWAISPEGRQALDRLRTTGWST